MTGFLKVLNPALLLPPFNVLRDTSLEVVEAQPGYAVPVFLSVLTRLLVVVSADLARVRAYLRHVYGSVSGAEMGSAWPVVADSTRAKPTGFSLVA